MKTGIRHTAQQQPGSESLCPRPHKAPGTAARDTVLSIPELLECILSHASMRDLLVAMQRVSKAWRDAIATSALLRQRLFFLAAAAPSQGRARQEKNPLLCEAFGAEFLDILSSVDVDPMHRFWPYRLQHLGVQEFMDLDLPAADMRNGRRRHRAFVRRGASWRRMLIAQPPVRSLSYGEPDLGSGPSRRITTYHTSAVPEGVRLGPLYDILFLLLWGRHVGRDQARTALVSWRNLTHPEEAEIIMRAEYEPDRRDLVVRRGSEYPERLMHRADYLRTRTRQSSAWMYQCEEYDEDRLLRALNENSLAGYMVGSS